MRILFFILFIITASCANNNSTNNSTTITTNSIADTTHHFVLDIVKPKQKKFKKLYDLLQKSNVLTNFINRINKRVAFPTDVKIEVVECDEVNAYYFSDSSKISICYEFLEYGMSLQHKDNTEEEKLLFSTAFTMLHEMGHAMIDKLDLPITGKEENAADELAMIILMSDTTDDTYFAAIDGTMQFYEDALQEDLTAYNYYDTHAPSLERYYDMLTMIVGADSVFAANMVGEGKYQLHPERAEVAEDEYFKKLDSWKRLLGTAWKEN